MLHSQRHTNNIDVIFITVHYLCYTTIMLAFDLTPPKSRNLTSKSTLQNCAERPIGEYEYMREKYNHF